MTSEHGPDLGEPDPTVAANSDSETRRLAELLQAHFAGTVGGEPTAPSEGRQPQPPAMPRAAAPQGPRATRRGTRTAPYSWVPAPAEVRPPIPTEPGEPLLSGVITVTVTALTPTFIRSGRVDPDPFPDRPRDRWPASWDDWSRGLRGVQDFAHHGDPEEPVLPGSEIRGLLRTLVSILGSGALITLSAKGRNSGPQPPDDITRALFGDVIVTDRAAVGGADGGPEEVGNQDAAADPDEPSIRPGRVVCEDLAAVPGFHFQPYCTTKSVLGGPKPGHAQHYTDGSGVRGFKLYPHNPGRWQGELVPLGDGRPPANDRELLARVGSEWDRPKQDDRARGWLRQRSVLHPVAAGARFRGRLRFSDLAAEEVGILLLALSLDPSMRHKLGMARSLGLGSVRIEIDQLVTIDPDERRRNPFDAGGGGFSSTEVETGPDQWRAWMGAFMAAHLRWSEVTPPTDVITAFWDQLRMRELVAILRWDTLIPPACLETMPLNDPRWRSPTPLPPASAYNAERIGNPE